MRPSIRTLRRLFAVSAVLVTVLALGGFQGELGVASADSNNSPATVISCDSNSSSTMSVDCGITLNINVDPGGAWGVMVTDTSANITACDGSASGATCSTSNNTAEFDCPAGCQANSAFKITVAASSATAMQENFAVLSPGTTAAAPPTSTANVPTITVGLGNLAPQGTSGGQVPYAGSSPAYQGQQPVVTTGPSTAGQQQVVYPSYGNQQHVVTSVPAPAQQLVSGPPQGGACVGGSVAGPNGCTSAGPLLPSVGLGSGYGSYGSCYGSYNCGGYYGSSYGGCYGVSYCGGSYNSFWGSSFGGCGSSSSACSACTFSLTCTLNGSPSNSACRTFFLRC